MGFLDKHLHEQSSRTRIGIIALLTLTLVLTASLYACAPGANPLSDTPAIDAKHWYCKQATTEGVSGLTESPAVFMDNEFYLETGGGRAGSLVLQIDDKRYTGTYIQLDNYDGLREDGEMAQAFVGVINSKRFYGFLNETTCWMSLTDDPDFIMIFSADSDAIITDIDVDFGDIESVGDCLDELDDF